MTAGIALRVSRRSAPEPPIRAELLGLERLLHHAASLAHSHRVTVVGGAGRSLLARVEDNARILREVNRDIAKAVHDGGWITPAAEWLVDNFYVVAEQLRQIRTDLPAGFYRDLPKLADGPLAGFPRVYGLAWSFVAHTDSHFEPETLRRFVAAYQRVQPLTIGELWAVPITLRVVLVENLRCMAEGIAHSRAAQAEADTLAEALFETRDGGRRASEAAAVLLQEGEGLASAFVVELLQRLRHHDPSVTPGVDWVHQCLVTQGTTADDTIRTEHQQQAAGTVTVRNIITSMRRIAALDWSEFVESVSLVDAALRAGSDYGAMDFASRDSYRHAIEDLARRTRRTELDIVRAVLDRARVAGAPAGPGEPLADRRRSDPGYYLVGAGRREFERAVGYRPRLRLRLLRAFVDLATPGYLGTLLLLSAAIVALPVADAWTRHLPWLDLLLLSVLALIPASDVAVAVLNRVVASIVEPDILPRLEWPAGIPEEGRTLVAVPTMLGTPTEATEQIKRLEVHYLANPDGDVCFALVTDFLDAATEEAPADAAILAAARQGVAQLNARHGPAPWGGNRFFLFHRRRVWNESEQVWMGWERKRGKLRELNRLLREAGPTTFLAATTGVVPTGIRYVVTLDRDTRLPVGAVKQLAATMAHPLNRPRFDPASQRVVAGYGVLQPRVMPPLPEPGASPFQRLQSTDAAGIDPYAGAVSDVYQDLFGEGSYIGKGIYDLDAFEAALGDRTPENALLSHDLFEGLFARAGLVTDIELFEAAPSSYLTAADRQHRWARGDWQLLPWILHERLSPVGRWKMIDNLRRTLSAPAAFLTLLAGWTWPGAEPLLWTGFVLTVLAIPRLLPGLTRVVPHGVGFSRRAVLRGIGEDLASAAGQWGLTIATLAHQAWLMGDAVLRTLGRVYITRRGLLEWTTTARVAAGVPSHLAGVYRRMGGALVLTGVATALVATQPAAWPVAAPILLLWGLAPVVVRWISAAPTGPYAAGLSPGEARSLRLIARRTWRFFETFVTPASHALPPDNFQETPDPVVAQRTSPTNIGLYLLSAISARDFGWIGTLDLVERLEATLGTVQSLEHHRGHLYNWYDPGARRPLEPRYISSVDSGNWAASLLTIAEACDELLQQAPSGLEALAGLQDAAALLRDALDDGTPERQDPAARQVLGAIEALLAAEALPAPVLSQRLALLASEVGATRPTVEAADAGDDEIRRATADCRTTIASHLRDCTTLRPWLLEAGPAATPAAAVPPEPSASLTELPHQCEAVRQRLMRQRADLVGQGAPAPALLELDDLIRRVEHAAEAATGLVGRLEQLAADARAIVAAMDFSFLYDPARKLFAIGYRMADGSLDSGRYDLLASEARLMSLVAIAKGDVPALHWFRLGRVLAPVGKNAALLSWSGSMFEYLLPELLIRSPAASLLAQSCRLAVERQIAYGAEHGVPWGISESGYNVRDKSMTYQYSNFGVPGLGLRRGLGEDLVIAPYATGLAAMIAPPAAVRNFRVLAAAGAAGPFGYYEALDYTTSRLPADAQRAVVQMYMAHHQGMLLVALGNVVHGGRMRQRFHTEPRIRASALLLQERTPRDVAVVRPLREPSVARADVRDTVPPHTRHYTTPHSATLRTQLLSNGRYAVMLTAAGSGYSRCENLSITRWREDVTRDDTGSYIFVRDVASAAYWSAAFQPSGTVPDSYEASFSEDRAEFHRHDGTIETRLEVIVSSEDDAEVRRVSLVNHGPRAREIELTSYAEIVLGSAAADADHPAFGNLFVQTEHVPEGHILLATRRPRALGEPTSWLAHVLAVEGDTVGEREWETDRARFCGRGRGVRTPQAMTGADPLSNTTGPVLDPIVSLRQRVRVPPGGTVRLTFTTLVGPTRQSVLGLAEKYRDVTTFERAATLAWTQAMVGLHHVGIGQDEAHLFQTLAGMLLFADRGMRATPAVLLRQTQGVAALWAHGISGDRPIVMAEIQESDDIGLVRQLLRAHEYWRLKGLAVDLVILNDQATSYQQDLQHQLDALVRANQALRDEGSQEGQGQVFALRADQIRADHRDVLESAARVVLSSQRGPLAAQVARGLRPDVAGVPVEPTHTKPPEAAAPLPGVGEYFNGLGGFTAGGREYAIVLPQGQWTPAPWINVLANADFGCLVSEAGSGCTWSVNSQANRLTPWANDPVSDPPSDMFYLRDLDSGELWSPTPLPIREPGGRYAVRHGQGWTRHDYAAHGVTLELLQFVAADDPVKIARLVVTNASARERRLSITAYLEWVLGTGRQVSAPFVITERDPATGAMLARNPWGGEFSGRIAFADLAGGQTSWTADRTEFLGRNGTLERPAALATSEPLSGRVGPALDPCCALQTIVTVPPAGRVEVALLLGQAASREEAVALVERYRTADLTAQLQTVVTNWDHVLDTVQVATPDRTLDLMLNRWLLYQTLACRVWGRTALYQSSGAYGFRDQLQDVMALTVARPDLTRDQILRSAARQFVEGDVQHWWHEPTGRGIRTRVSDDLLWLPYVVGHMLEVTDDQTLLDHEIPFLTGAPLTAGQAEAYFEPRVAEEKGTLYEHCARTIDRSLAVGAHGLPLMGTGDWNDGMNAVGAGGQGESVWLAWFLYAVLTRWAPLAHARGETTRAETWRTHAASLMQAVDASAWDGEWYRRAYFDDGTPLGTAGSDACAIDSIAQSWSVLSGGATPERARRAMQALDQHLVRPVDDLILLLSPPFGDTALEPGYIKGYLPGVRENGGQYTHAAVWAVIAFAMLGDGDKAAALFRMLNPITHTSTAGGVARYRSEPYVLAGDVYSQEPHVGRGGWSWYTGSAGWLYRAGLEWLLGFRLRGDRLALVPCIPSGWQGFSITFRYRSARYEIEVDNRSGAGRGVSALQLDGVAQDDLSGIPLVDDQATHHVRVVLGEGAA